MQKLKLSPEGKEGLQRESKHRGFRRDLERVKRVQGIWRTLRSEEIDRPNIRVTRRMTTIGPAACITFYFREHQGRKTGASGDKLLQGTEVLTVSF